MADWHQERTRQALAAALLQHNGLATVVVDADWTIVFACGALDYVGGFAGPDDLVGRSALELVHPEDLEVALAGIATAEGLPPDDGEVNIIGNPVALRMVRADGSTATVTVAAANLLHHPDVEAIALRVQLAEVQTLVDRFVELLATGAEREEALQPLADALAASIPDAGTAIVVPGEDGPLVVRSGLGPAWGAALVHATTGDPGAVRGLAPSVGTVAAVAPARAGRALTSLAAAAPGRVLWAWDVGGLAAPDRAAGTIVVARTDREELPFNNRQDLQRAARFVSLAVHQWDQDRRLRHAAHHDPLTGLANRSLLARTLEDLDATGTPYGLVFVDLDGFKPVNDAHGHSTGDRVLVATAERLRRCTGAGDLVARVGGDEFALVLPGDDVGGLTALCTRVEADLAEPVLVDGTVVRLGASAGGAHSSVGGGATAVMRAADTAMYQRKRASGIEAGHGSRSRSHP